MYNKELPKGWRKYIKDEFKKADTDNSGTVSKKELAATVFQAIDGNDDGVISLDEMKGAVKYIAKVSDNKLIADWEAKVEAAFKYVDSNGDGEVSSKEAWKALKKHGLDMNGLFE
jgi:Ca2+-binding EF-hand superfamily protein